MMFVGVGQVSASAIYIDTYSDNDNNLTYIQGLVSQWFLTEYDFVFDATSLEEYAKVNFDEDGDTSPDGNLVLNYNMNDEDESTSGFWSTTDTVNLFSVKAGNGNSGGGFALYWLGDETDPTDSTYWGASGGYWNTDDVYSRGISHFSTWTLTDGGDPPAGQVPEPSTMLLFGLGILGLAGFGRKRLS
jgi:hypothetical protein